MCAGCIGNGSDESKRTLRVSKVVQSGINFTYLLIASRFHVVDEDLYLFEASCGGRRDVFAKQVLPTRLLSLSRAYAPLMNSVST
jgi:hypothetical protein